MTHKLLGKSGLTLLALPAIGVASLFGIGFGVRNLGNTTSVASTGTYAATPDNGNSPSSSELDVSSNPPLPAADTPNDAAAQVGAEADSCSPGACISNGTVKLAVSPHGHLGIDDVQGPFPEAQQGALVYLPNGAIAASYGCQCEGWGVADRNTGTTGYADDPLEGRPINLLSTGFTAGKESARSVNVVPNGFEVTHLFRPSRLTENLYEIVVTIRNISTSDFTHVTYRTIIDWDIDPRPSHEFVTVDPGNSRLIKFDSEDGLVSPNPLTEPSDFGHVGTFRDAGPDDLGADFDLDFGHVAAGHEVSFEMFYGAAASELDANRALAAVKAEAYALGQPNVKGGADFGQPNTFILAFAGIDGAPLFAPAAESDILTTQAGTIGTVNVLQNDNDPNHESLTVISSTNGAHGAVSCTPQGSCSYKPVPDYIGVDQFSYTVSNTSGGTDSGLVTVDIAAPLNQPPTVSAGADVSAVAGISFALAGVAADPDADPLTTAWTIISVDHPGAEASCRFGATSTAATQVTCDQTGVYIAALTASDGVNPAQTDEATITVAPPSSECTHSIKIELPLNGGYLSVADLHTYSGSVGVKLICGRYTVNLTSGDANHAPGYQPNQTGEQWLLEGLDVDGKVIYTSPVTPDLADDQREATFFVDTADLLGVVNLRGRHGGSSGTDNSLHYIAVELTPAASQGPGCNVSELITGFPLNDYLGAADGHRFSTSVPVHLLCRHYGITLTSGDSGHRQGYQSEQTNEQWVLEGLDAAGNVIFASPATPDLPESQTTSVFDMGEADLRDVVQLRARHAGLGAGVNSLHQVSVALTPAT